MCLGIQCQILRVAGSPPTDNGSVCGGAIHGHAELSSREIRRGVTSFPVVLKLGDTVEGRVSPSLAGSQVRSRADSGVRRGAAGAAKALARGASDELGDNERRRLRKFLKVGMKSL